VTTEPQFTIEAHRFLDARQRIVASASLLADEVVRRLAEHDVLLIDLRGMRGVTSSYYNVLLQRVLSVLPMSDLPRRVRFCFDSAAQEQIYGRSLESATRGAA
jgi:hypothetical protein